MRILKRILLAMLGIVALLTLGIGLFFSSISPKMANQKEDTLAFTAQRLTDAPIVDANSHPFLAEEAITYGYTNINGPTLIRVPDWVSNPMGKYYLYFAHHKGAFIRLAYADSLPGPWTICDEKIMPLAESGFTLEETAPSGLKALRKYNTWSESIALIEIGAKAKDAWEKRTKEKMNSSAPTKPHVASPEVIIDEEAIGIAALEKNRN